MSKKIICVVLTLVLTLGLFAACGGKQEPAGAPTTINAQPENTSKSFSVVTTIFPEYDWVKTLVGERADAFDLTMLLDSGVDLHNYQPTAQDILKVSQCDMFIYVGGESDGWVDDVLAQAENKDMIVINLLETLGNRVKAEEVKEGMEAEQIIIQAPGYMLDANEENARYQIQLSLQYFKEA